MDDQHMGNADDYARVNRDAGDWYYCKGCKVTYMGQRSECPYKCYNGFVLMVPSLFLSGAMEDTNDPEV